MKLISTNRKKILPITIKSQNNNTILMHSINFPKAFRLQRIPYMNLRFHPLFSTGNQHLIKRVNIKASNRLLMLHIIRLLTSLRVLNNKEPRRKIHQQPITIFMAYKVRKVIYFIKFSLLVKFIQRFKHIITLTQNKFRNIHNI